MRRSRKRGSGLPAQFTAYSGTRNGVTLEVGTGKAYADLDAALDYLATQAWASSSAFSGTVTATQGSASVTGSGFNSISGDNYLQVGNDYWAIKSIESDGAATLWHGAQITVSGSTATYKTLNPFTVEWFEHQTLSAKSIPVGLSLLFIGSGEDKQLKATSDVGLTVPSQGYIEITHCSVYLAVTSGGYLGVLRGGVTTSEAIYNLHDFRIKSNNADSDQLGVFAGASITIKRLYGSNYAFSIYADYIYIDTGEYQTSGNSDHFLVSRNVDTDSGHPWSIVNYQSISTGAVQNSFSTGLEFNTIPSLGKTINISDSKLIAYHTAILSSGNAQAQVLWASYTGTINVTDCVLDCVNSDYEIFDRGATLNITNTARLDGSAVRLIAPP